MPAKRFRVLLGRRLRASRLSLGFDADNFAEELGMTPDAYEQVELGEKEPGLIALVHAAKITGKSLDFLVTGRRFLRCGTLLSVLMVELIEWI